MKVLRKLKIELTYNTIISLLVIYQEEIKILKQQDICTSLFTIALFTITKTWKQPKCPWINDWIKNNGILLCNGILVRPKKKKRMKFCHLQQHVWT